MLHVKTWALLIWQRDHPAAQKHAKKDKNKDKKAASSTKCSCTSRSKPF